MIEALRHLRVPSDRDPAPSELRAQTQDPGPPLRLPAATQPGRVPDLAGLSLREALAALSAQGYEARVQGSGVVTYQHPLAGQPLEPGGSCKLILEELRPQRVAAGEPAGAGGAG